MSDSALIEGPSFRTSGIQHLARLNRSGVEKITEQEILRQGLRLGSDKWNKAKEGNLSGAGRTRSQWRTYVVDLEKKREFVLSLMKDDVRKQMASFNFMIEGLGAGGSWTISRPMDAIPWDDIDDRQRVVFKGASVSYSRDRFPGDYVLMHEYGHGMFDVYGAFAGGDSRLIDKSDFERDAERLMLDPAQKDNPFVKDLIASSGVQINGNRAAIDQETTELFAIIGELFVSADNKLPSYITRHYAPLLKTDVIKQHTLPEQ